MMKKIVPFTKEINFKTMISKITSISLEHTLRVSEKNLISGYFIVDGTYKMTQASQIDEEFSYKIPVDIELNDRYDTKNITIDIDDFTYEVVDEERLNLNISVCLDNLIEKEELISEPVVEDFSEMVSKDNNSRANNDVLDDLFLDTSDVKDLEINLDNNNNKGEDQKDKIELIDEESNPKTTKKEMKENTMSKQDITNSDNETVNSLFASFKDDTETFKTYSVYIMKEDDSLDNIFSKYNVDRDLVAEYNDLSTVKVGSKIIIPSEKHE